MGIITQKPSTACLPKFNLGSKQNQECQPKCVQDSFYNWLKEKESCKSLKSKVEEPQEEMSSREENARIAKEAYHFEENPIFIPDNLKHGRIESNADEPLVKKPRTDFEESNEIHLDTETMMKDFVLDFQK